MNSSQAVQLMLNNRVDKERDLLHKVVKTLKDSNVPGTGAALQLIPETHKSLNDRKYNELLEAWYDYRIPIFTISEWVELVQRNAQDIHHRQRKREKAKYISKYKAAVDAPNATVRCVGNAQANLFNQFLIEPETETVDLPPSLAVEATEFLANQSLIRDDKTTWAICPNSLTKISVPIRYTYQPSLQDFQQNLVYFPMTSVINLTDTLKSCLSRGEKLGYDRQQLITVLKSFVENHYQEYYISIQPITDPHLCFKAILNLIHSYSVLPTINNLLKSLTRSPKDTIHTFYLKYSSLLVTKIEQIQPHLTHKQITTKAESIAKQNLIHFLENSTRECYTQFLKIQNELGEPPTTSESLLFIRDLEASSPLYELQSQKTNNQDSDVNLFPNNIQALVTTRSDANPDRPRRMYNIPRHKSRPIPTNYARKRNVPNTPKSPAPQKPKQVSFSPRPSTPHKPKQMNSPHSPAHTPSNGQRQNFKPYQQHKNVDNRRPKIQFNAHKFLHPSLNSSYRNHQNYKRNVAAQSNFRRDNNYKKFDGKKQLNDRQFQSRFSHFMEKEYLKGRVQKNNDPPTCLRCLSRFHSDQNCDRYKVTTLTPCSRCGNQAFHYSNICQGRHPK